MPIFREDFSFLQEFHPQDYVHRAIFENVEPPLGFLECYAKQLNRHLNPSYRSDRFPTTKFEIFQVINSSMDLEILLTSERFAHDILLGTRIRTSDVLLRTYQNPKHFSLVRYRWDLCPMALQGFVGSLCGSPQEVRDRVEGAGYVVIFFPRNKL
jgi:hypothetical protein